MEAIKDSAIYIIENISQLSELYYLVFGKSYSEDKSTWKIVSTIMHLYKMINTFYKYY